MPSYEKIRRLTFEFIRKELQNSELPISLDEVCWRAVEKYGVGRKICEEFVSRLIQTGKVNGKDQDNLVWVGEEEEQEEDLTNTENDKDMEEFLQ